MPSISINSILSISSGIALIVLRIHIKLEHPVLRRLNDFY